MERERTREPDADQTTDYEKSMRLYQQWADRQKNGDLLIRADKHDYQASRQGFLKYYMTALTTDTAVSSWCVFEQLIKKQSGRHRHQGGIIIYAIEGEGSTHVNGEVLEWKAGDLLLLPIVPGGCVHQHWNRDVSKGCRWVAFEDLMLCQYTAKTMEQVTEMPDFRGGAYSAPDGVVRKGWKTTVNGDQVPLVTSPDELANANLFDRLLTMRDQQRARLAKSTFTIRGDELPWELNAHGRMQWYLHPCIAYTAVQTHVLYRQEIPVGSRSGVHRHGGDIVFYMLEGEGYTEVDGVHYNWKSGDLMTLPIWPAGVVYRHVNTGSTPVRLIAVERNLVHMTGVDRQSGFEQLQPCPEYRAAQSF